MALPRRLIALCPAPVEAHTQACIDRWRSSGLEVHTICSAAPRELVLALNATPADGIAVWGAEPWMLHAIHRSTRHPTTPVTLFFEGEEGLTTSRHLDAPFWEDPVAPSRPPTEWDAMLRRAMFRSQFRVLFRSDWHAFAVGRRLESPLRDAVVAPPPMRAPRPHRRQLRRLFFPGLIDGARRHGADLFVRTALELLRREDQALELVVATEKIRDERILAPLGRRVIRLSEDEALLTSTFALVTTRGGHGLQQVVSCAGEGLHVVALQHPAIDELFHQTGGLTEDPGQNAEFLRVLLSDARVRGERQKAIGGRMSLRCDPNSATRAELSTFDHGAPKGGRSRAQPVLTVVVPAFNASAFLARCVESLVAGQAGGGGLEIVVVNDGSTDETGALAMSLSQRHGAVRVIHQENAGHGGAINAGLAVARGTYFRVVDADDWVDPLALHGLLTALRLESADLVLTDYAEDKPGAPLPTPVDILGRLPAGALCRFDTIVDPLFGLTSWGPILATSTFRTDLLRKADLRLTEKSAYVDLEYCTLGLEFVETMRHLPLDLYRYSTAVDGQSVSPESYKKRFREHEQVILRLCEFVSRPRRLSEVKRRYIIDRVLAPVVRTHLHVVGQLLKDRGEERSFRRKLANYPAVPVPPRRRVEPAALVRRAAKSGLPEPLVKELAGRRGAASLVRAVTDYVLPSGLVRLLGRD